MDADNYSIKMLGKTVLFSLSIILPHIAMQVTFFNFLWGVFVENLFYHKHPGSKKTYVLKFVRRLFCSDPVINCFSQAVYHKLTS